MAKSENALLFITFFQRTEIMVKPTQSTGKVIPFVTGQSSPEGQLEKWFRTEQQRFDFCLRAAA
jgi:hypothetical protein